MQSGMNYREQRGSMIANIEGAVKRIAENTYTVQSQSGHGQYNVIKSELGLLCSCPDSMFRGHLGVVCKHAYAVASNYVQQF